MKLKDILAISGKSGLYKFISQGRNGIIVESFDDQKRTVVHASAKVSALEDIAIFTETEEVPLADVFKKLYEKEDGRETINHKSSNEELKALLKKILPDYDKSRVYVSDIKKLVNWYNILIRLDLIKPGEEDDQEEDQEKTESGKKDKDVKETSRVKHGSTTTATKKPSANNK
ncbi:MAG: DUF5606 domain-containing protein [Bacteroidales bacterium]|nr:DUF5606 domain-containing protein [Bacteroidales bacterium]